ncbi:hypothetical protein D1AOALGA4SA_4848 [Olavius algarvensis Delta 1 endosymbiont]|nr:hypothetical protein D1AOALGA4SA_4848 [Olavius algarvensis Delta 1 endosymbiont]
MFSSSKSKAVQRHRGKGRTDYRSNSAPGSSRVKLQSRFQVSVFRCQNIMT